MIQKQKGCHLQMENLSFGTNDNHLTLEIGITFLFDAEETLKTIIKKQLGCDYIEDKYLYIVGMNARQLTNYHRAVSEKCEEINEIYQNNSGINEAVVCPKMMFLFEDMKSCDYFREYFEKIDDPVEKVQAELAYGSTGSIAMKLAIPNPLV